MKRYDKYKPSGIDWIGEVPEHWEKCRLKNVLRESLMYGANESAECDNPDYPRYIRITDMTDDGKLRDETFKSLEPIKAKPYLLKCGDMLFARSGATVGKTFLFEMDIVACFAGYLIKASFNTTVLPKFVFFYTQSGIYDNWKNSVFIQATIQNIGADKYANMPFIRPSIEEQNKIVAYLDARCADIDKVVATQQKRIALLQELKQSEITQAVTRGLNPDARMKDSGVEWIGCVPEHWEIKKLKYHFYNYKAGPFGSSLITSKLLPEGDILVYTPEHIANQTVDLDNNLYLPNEREEEMSQFIVMTGDIIFPIVGTLGRAMVISEDMPKGIINQRLAKFKIKDTLDVDFFMILFADCDIYKQHIEANCRGSIIVNLTKELVGDVPIITPPIEEQIAIKRHLCFQCGKIDTQIKAVTKQIELLREYKQALITEVVTGKRKV